MALPFPRPQLQGVLVVAAVLLLSCLDGTKSEKCNSTRADLESLVPPYVDSYGAPTASVEVSFPLIGTVKLGALYERNLTLDTPAVVLTGPALQSDRYYTLITVDPEAGIATNVLHFLITNIPGSITPSQDAKIIGQVVNPWLDPRPPLGTGVHRYMFLLFEQEYGNITATRYVNFTHFSVRDFSKTFDLEPFPLGGTLFRVAAPDYVSN